MELLTRLKKYFLPTSDGCRQDNVMHCKPFIDTMELYKKQLNEKDGPENLLFVIPKALKAFTRVYLFHEVTKDVEFINIPDCIVHVDMLRNPEKEIHFINKLVRDQTNGMFQELDPTTQSNLRNKDFRYLLLGLFYLKAKWNGVNVGIENIYNKNKTITPLQFFTLESHHVDFFMDRVYVRVPYRCSENEEEDKDSFVIFSQSAFRLDKNCKRALAHLPEMTLEYREESGNGLENLVTNFKYRQDEKGFEAACMYACDQADSPSDPVQDIYFNSPFKIKVFFSKIESV